MLTSWEVEYTDKFETWWATLPLEQQRHIAQGVELLAEYGPSLGRPLVDTVTMSRHANMKELRASTTRTLFAFDPRRSVILLFGGDKSGKWNAWYDKAIPIADDLFDDHIQRLADEGLI